VWLLIAPTLAGQKPGPTTTRSPINAPGSGCHGPATYSRTPDCHRRPLGLTTWWRNRRRIDSEPGHLLFLVALVLTAVGSGIYHLSPGDARLVWDRLPIALGCAGLLASVRAGTRGGSARTAVAPCVAAVASVLWWRITNGTGEGDLRPYLLLQGLPLVLIPLRQAIYGAPRSHRLRLRTGDCPLRRGEDGERLR
jgi:hypothetical protein